MQQVKFAVAFNLRSLQLASKLSRAASCMVVRVCVFMTQWSC